jgi:putative ABC transport system substrate-binding protein
MHATAFIAVFMVALTVLITPFVAEAQQAGKKHRIGHLHPGDAPALGRAGVMSGFRDTLKELGYVEGQDYVLEHRYASGQLDRLPDLATELIRAQVDIILAVGGQAIDAARRATGTIPIVMLFSGLDPVAAGRVHSLARPGGNVTGIAMLAAEITEKRLELLLELAPRARRVAYVYVGSGALAPDQAARRLGVTLVRGQVTVPDEVDRVLTSLARQKVGAVLFGPEPTWNRAWRHIFEATARHRLPASYEVAEAARMGGLMALGPDFVDLGRRGASFVDRILKGARPAELPVEQPTKFELVINLKTAKVLGLTIPPSLLLRANQIVE